MDRYHANEIQKAIHQARTLGQDFVTIGAGGMKHINVPLDHMEALARQANRWTRQAIRTRFHGPTNSKPARISARYAGGSIFVSFDHGLEITENHRKAAQKLADQLDWGTVTDGACFDNDHYWLTAKA